MIHHIAAAALIASQATAAATPERCLTREQAGDMAVTVMPMVLGALTERCRPHVGANAFLNTGAEAMLSRLRAAAAPRRTSAFAAFARMAPPLNQGQTDSDADGMAEMDAGMDVDADADGDLDADVDLEVQADESEAEGQASQGSALPFDLADNPAVVEAFATAMLTAALAGMDQRACADANVLVESLAPLPPENIARIAGAALGMIGNARPDMPNNPLCPA